MVGIKSSLITQDNLNLSIKGSYLGLNMGVWPWAEPLDYPF